MGRWRVPIGTPTTVPWVEENEKKVDMMQEIPTTTPYAEIKEKNWRVPIGTPTTMPWADEDGRKVNMKWQENTLGPKTIETGSGKTKSRPLEVGTVSPTSAPSISQTVSPSVSPSTVIPTSTRFIAGNEKNEPVAVTSGGHTGKIAVKVVPVPVPVIVREGGTGGRGGGTGGGGGGTGGGRWQGYGGTRYHHQQIEKKLPPPCTFQANTT